MSFTLQQREGGKKKSKSGRYPTSLTISGCVYIKSALVVSGNGKNLCPFQCLQTLEDKKEREHICE